MRTLDGVRGGIALVMIAAAAGCSSAAVPAPPAGTLPDLGEREDPLSEKEKSLNAAGAIQAAAQALRDREDSPSHAISLLRHHWPAARDSAELNTLLAEAHARLIDSLDLTKDGSRHEHHRNAGSFHAREAIRLKPDAGDARYWLGALLLYRADAERSYGLLKDALKEMIEAERLAPKVDSGGPDRMIGRIYQETPGFPFLGSKSKAIDYYRKSLAIAPDLPLTHLWLAETYLADKQPDPAREEARRVLGGKPRPGYEKGDEQLRQAAQELLKKSGGAK
jgi:tetratricopeptide (TPR) repeat protein